MVGEVGNRGSLREAAQVPHLQSTFIAPRCQHEAGVSIPGQHIHISVMRGYCQHVLGCSGVPNSDCFVGGARSNDILFRGRPLNVLHRTGVTALQDQEGDE